MPENLFGSGGVRGLFDWFVDACLAVLVGALALTAAVWLLKAIWPALAIAAGCVVALLAIVVAVRWWRNRW